MPPPTLALQPKKRDASNQPLARWYVPSGEDSRVCTSVLVSAVFSSFLLSLFFSALLAVHSSVLFLCLFTAFFNCPEQTETRVHSYVPLSCLLLLLFLSSPIRIFCTCVSAMFAALLCRYEPPVSGALFCSSVFYGCFLPANYGLLCFCPHLNCVSLPSSAFFCRPGRNGGLF